MNYEDDLMMYGVLSNNDIEEAMSKGAIFIAPFDESQLQPSGYNLTPTYFIYSTKKKKLLPIIRQKNKVFVMIDKNDTVLIRTRESIAVSSNITGEFNSKLRNTAIGFGHISTTLDPGWEGQLLIPYNNPTDKKIEFVIEEKACGRIIYNSFVTLTFYHMNSVATKSSDNKSGRWDILDETVYRNNSILKRKKVEILEDLADQLKERDNCGLESCILKNLNEAEREQYDNLEDNPSISEEEYCEARQKLLAKYMRAHIRKIRNMYQQEMEKSIDVVNKYIDTKQKFLPLRYRFCRFIVSNLKAIMGIVVLLIILIIWHILGNRENVDSKKVTDYALGALAAYILFPLFVKAIEKWFLDKIR